MGKLKSAKDKDPAKLTVSEFLENGSLSKEQVRACGKWLRKQDPYDLLSGIPNRIYKMWRKEFKLLQPEMSEKAQTNAHKLIVKVADARKELEVKVDELSSVEKKALGSIVPWSDKATTKDQKAVQRAFLQTLPED